MHLNSKEVKKKKKMEGGKERKGDANPGHGKARDLLAKPLISHNARKQRPPFFCSFSNLDTAERPFPPPLSLYAETTEYASRRMRRCMESQRITKSLEASSRSMGYSRSVTPEHSCLLIALLHLFSKKIFSISRSNYEGKTGRTRGVGSKNN